MRAVWIAAGLMLLAGCQREKSFDERYAEASAAIGGTARDIDGELDARASGAASGFTDALSQAEGESGPAEAAKP